MKKLWRYERRNIFLPFPRNFAITMIISTVSKLDNISRALRISDNWFKPSYYSMEAMKEGPYRRALLYLIQLLID